MGRKAGKENIRLESPGREAGIRSWKKKPEKEAGKEEIIHERIEKKKGENYRRRKTMDILGLHGIGDVNQMKVYAINAKKRMLKVGAGRVL